jgi:glyoxylase-like metal-dependent hydrolase (beta-lactamase superfamily II)
MVKRRFVLSKPLGVIPVLAITVVLGTAGLGKLSHAQENHSGAQQSRNGDDAEIHVLPVQGNVYMLAGAGGNITVQAGKEGILLVDTGPASMSDKVFAAIRTISDKPIRYIINTSVDPSSTGGNESIAKRGSTIAGGNVVGTIGASAGEGATVIAFQAILDRMSAPTGKKPPSPEGAWPTDTFTTNEKNLFFNGEAIQILHQPAAHTDGDSLVFFRRSDVVSTGEIFTMAGYPVIDLEKGGSIQGIIDGLNRLVYQITIPADKEEGGTFVIPGRGRLCDQADVIYYQEMVIIIRDRIQDMVKKGMTLEQVKAAHPTKDYDPRYGANTGPWTTDMFVEAVYHSLSKKH